MVGFVLINLFEYYYNVVVRVVGKWNEYYEFEIILNIF